MEDDKQFLYEHYKQNHNLNELYYQVSENQKKILDTLIEEFYERYEREKCQMGNTKQNEDDKTGKDLNQYNNYNIFQLSHFPFKLPMAC